MLASSGPMPDATERSTVVIAETLAWVELAVVGLNLCPFAKAPLVKGQVRCVASDAAVPEALLADLCTELDLLAAAAPAAVETTLLVHPGVLADFDDFNDFLDVAEAAVTGRGLDGVIQLASFHPHYRFAGTESNDIGNATNRAPHPTLQLLRESSVERAVAAIPDAERIFDANIRTLEALGPAGWTALQDRCRRRAGRQD